jgi:hypothetical protein
MKIRFSNRVTGGLLATVAALALTPPLKAQNTAGLDPVGNLLDRLFAAETQKWWLWDLSLPLPRNPTQTPGVDCSNGQSGDVWFLYGGPPTVTCRVPFGKAVFFPIANTECSSLEPAPYFGRTPAERRACAKAWIDNLTNLSATIDRIKIPDLSLFRVQSGDFRFTVPANNILGVPGPASGLSSADGYYLLLPILLPGITHTIHVTATFRDPFDPAHPVVFPLDTIITLTVGR